MSFMGFPWWLSGKESACQCRRHKRRFDPWIGTIPWRRKWQPTPVFLPGKSHGRGSPVGYSPWGCKESDTTERFHFTSLHIYEIKFIKVYPSLWGFSSGSVVKNLPDNVGDSDSIPGSGKIPWRRKWQPTPIFLPGESHGQMSLMGYSP